MAKGAGIREIAECTCLRLRQTSRRVTQLYDAALAPAGLTIGQFGLLAHLYVLRDDPELRSVRSVAEITGTDPTSLNRMLKPLEREGLVVSESLKDDRRVRVLKITSKGIAKLQAALTLWRGAQSTVKKALGPRDHRALTELLDTTIRSVQA